MIEADFTFDSGLIKGMRRFHKTPRNSQELVECHNWMPAEQGLKPPELITLIVVANTYDQTPD